MSRLTVSLTVGWCIVCAIGCRVIRPRHTSAEKAGTSVAVASKPAPKTELELGQASYEQLEANSDTPIPARSPYYFGRPNTSSASGGPGTTKRC